MTDKLICSTSSRAVGEQLFGTATRVDFWFLLEVPQGYGYEAFEESSLRDEVKDHLRSAAESVPNGRVQLIKRGANYNNVQEIKFFVVVNHEEEPNIYEFTLSRYKDLLDLDLAGILAEREAFWEYDRKEPLYLVCTNGKRDACCAVHGMFLYSQMRTLVGNAVWQTSHLGGHRFAPTMVILPHGVYYGYVGDEDAVKVVQAAREEKVFLPRYRGRSCYEKNVQAAEYYLREKFDLLDLYRFKLVEIEPAGDAEWIFHFSDLRSGETYCAQTRQVLSEFEVFKSCVDAVPVNLPQHQLVDFQRHAAVGRVK